MPIASTPTAVTPTASNPVATSATENNLVVTLTNLTSASWQASSVSVDCALSPLVGAAWYGTSATFTGALANLTLALSAVVETKNTMTVALPAITSTIETGCALDNLTLGKLTCSVRAATGGLVRVDAAIPAFTCSMSAGGAVRASLPQLRVTASMATATVTRVAVTRFARLTMSAHSTMSNMVKVRMELGDLAFAAASGVSASGRLGRLRMLARELSGSTAAVIGKLSAVKLVAPIAQRWLDQTHLILRLGSLRVLDTAKVTIALPRPTTLIVAHQASNQTVSWRTHLVNLKHDPRYPPTGEANVDEVTEYTNYPFVSIIRVRDAYYGLAPDGLHRLNTGETDNGAPVHFEMRTGINDFSVPERKVFVSAYLAGRLGANMSVTLYPGEVSPQPQAFATPRGAVAQTYRQRFGLGNRERYYALGMSGDDVFRLDKIGCEINNLTRRM